MNTLTAAQITAIATEAALAAVTAALAAQEPAKASAAKPKASDAKSEAFVTWLHETAEARAERKATNKTLAAALRKAGLEARGAAWDAAKAALAEGKTVRQAVAAAKKA